MARSFDGSSSIQGSIGGLIGTPGGAHTIAVIAKRGTSGTDMVLVSLETSANTSKLALEWGSTNNLNLVIGSSSKDTNVDVATTDNWVCAVVNRASGTSTPRGHKYVFDSDTWTHTDAGATSGGDSSDLTAGRIQIAQWQNTARFTGDIAVAAVWKRSLSDAEVETLASSLQAWYATAPDALWVLDQHATTHNVIDAGGGGANQTSITGTAVSTASVPVFNYGAGASAGVAQVAAAGTQNATAALDVTAAATAAAAVDKPVTATLTATAAATPAAATTKPVTATLTAAAAVTPAATATKPVDSTLTGTAAFTAAAASTKPVTAALTATATITATATVGTPPVAVDAARTLTATITAAAATTKPVQAALSATATITASMSLAGDGLTGRVHGPEAWPPGAVVSHTGTIAGGITG